MHKIFQLANRLLPWTWLALQRQANYLKSTPRILSRRTQRSLSTSNLITVTLKQNFIINILLSSASFHEGNPTDFNSYRHADSVHWERYYCCFDSSILNWCLALTRTHISSHVYLIALILTHFCPSRRKWKFPLDLFHPLMRLRTYSLYSARCRNKISSGSFTILQRVSVIDFLACSSVNNPVTFLLTRRYALLGGQWIKLPARIYKTKTEGSLASNWYRVLTYKR